MKIYFWAENSELAGFAEKTEIETVTRDQGLSKRVILLA